MLSNIPVLKRSNYYFNWQVSQVSGGIAHMPERIYRTYTNNKRAKLGQAVALSGIKNKIKTLNNNEK